MKNKIFLAGEWKGTKEKLVVVNPYTQEIITSVSLSDKAIVNEAIESAMSCEEKYHSFSTGEISRILMQITHSLESRLEEFTQLIIAESAKPYVYAKGEVLRAIETFRVASEECKRTPSELIDLDWSTPGIGKKGRVEYKSVGIVAGISPFNFPINLVAHKIAPAIATKSPIILKPSSLTPLSALLLAEVISETDLPKGALSVLPSSREVGQFLVEDERIAVLSFTGSPDVGWKMKTESGKKKVVLELGGNAAAIVHKDADFDLAINKLLVGGFAYSGQVCIHTQRVFIHESIFARFENEFVKLTTSLKTGNPLEESTQFSVMIDEKNAKRVENWLEEAVDQGAEILAGGKRDGLYFEPTIVKNAKRGMKIYDEEVFGPIVCIQPYSDIDEAIELVNDSRFGLQAALFTDTNSVIEQCFAEIQVGALIVNDSTTFRVDQMPYGGVKDSGLGREGVKYAMMDYLEMRLMVF